MKQTSLVLPALRGSFGDWIYYSCLMPVQEVGARVQYAEEIHPDKALSELIQRSLEGPRAKHIAEYLGSTKERFFNALVLATYRGSPEWLEVGNFKSTTRPEILKEISQGAMDSLGFLSLKGSEKIFAIDGQHRVAGIKRALVDGLAFGHEQVPVLLVGHKKDAGGMQRTRRLFTTLNKTAVRVRKRDIIALDEDDVMAITARRLVETNPSFRDPKIAVISSQNIPVGDRVCLTTISNLYDVLRLLFMFDTGKHIDRDLRFNRPGDERLEHYYDFAVSYFMALGEAFTPVRSFFASSKPGDVTAKQRGSHGGHLIFRPVGLDIFTRIVIEFATTREVELGAAVNELKELPTDLSRAPYRHVIWDPVRHRIVVGGKRVARELVRYMAGLRPDEQEGRSLLDDYRLAVSAAVDEKEVKLPAKLF